MHPGRQRLACAACRTPDPVRPTSVECIQCGSGVQVPKRGPVPRYCSSSCRSRASDVRQRADGRLAQKQRERRERTREANRGKVCAICGGLFDAGSAKAKYCSKRCSRAANRARESARGQCSTPGCDKGLRARGLCATHYNATYHKGSQRKYDDPEKRRVWLRRRTQWRRALTRDPSADLIDRDEIGERDGWRCGICRRKVDSTLAYPHPRSPSLDHIVPLSLGGRHVRENVRIAHLSCNVRRSNDSSGFEQTLLIG